MEYCRTCPRGIGQDRINRDRMEQYKTKLMKWNKVGLNVEGWNMVGKNVEGWNMIGLSVLLDKLLTVSGVLCLGFLFIFYAYLYQMGPFSRCKSFVVLYLVMLAT